MNRKKILSTFLIVAAIIVAVPYFKSATKDIGYVMVPAPSYKALESAIVEVIEDKLISKTAVPVHTELAPEEAKEIPVVLLNKNNMLVLRGPVSEDSINDLKRKMLKLSAELPDDAHIYLVLDTPGGSVGAGLGFIDAAKAIPQEVHTITLFAASMGFQIVQNMNNRYVTPSGTLMSHRAHISGLSGEIPGELIVRLNYFLKVLNRLDKVTASRSGMTVENYQELIRDEYWVEGEEAVKDQMADREILFRCSKDLIDGEDEMTLRSFFGTVKLKFSKCPLLTAPIEASYEFETQDAAEQESLKLFSESYFENRRNFVDTYILTEKYREFIK